MLDICRVQGIGPISRWVNDHIFFCIPSELPFFFCPASVTNICLAQHHAAYNLEHQRWHETITHNQGCCQSGSRFWYQGEDLLDGSPAEFDKDAACPIADYSIPNHSKLDSLFTHCDANIDHISGQLGILWEPSKTVPFVSTIPYLGFDWNLPKHSMAITASKRDKYRAAIEDWLPHSANTLEEAQKLYDKLLHASLVLLASRAYLTSLESLMASFNGNPFVPHHAPCHTSAYLACWLDMRSLHSPTLSGRTGLDNSTSRTPIFLVNSPLIFQSLSSRNSSHFLAGQIVWMDYPARISTGQ
jgi:hypothetical protein